MQRNRPIDPIQSPEVRSIEESREYWERRAALMAANPHIFGQSSMLAKCVEHAEDLLRWETNLAERYPLLGSVLAEPLRGLGSCVSIGQSVVRFFSQRAVEPVQPVERVRPLRRQFI